MRVVCVVCCAMLCAVRLIDFPALAPALVLLSRVLRPHLTLHISYGLCIRDSKVDWAAAVRPELHQLEPVARYLKKAQENFAVGGR